MIANRQTEFIRKNHYVGKTCSNSVVPALAKATFYKNCLAIDHSLKLAVNDYLKSKLMRLG